LGEWCNDLLKGGTVQNLAACKAKENDNVNNNDNAYAWTAVNYYTWDLSFNDAKEAAKTCYIVQQWGGDYTSHHLYNKKQSGSVFDYLKGKKKSGGKGAIIAVLSSFFSWLLLQVSIGPYKARPRETRSELRSLMDWPLDP
jgi:hypothetical protein